MSFLDLEFAIAQDDRPEAERLFLVSFEIWKRIGLLPAQAQVMRRLGDVHIARGPGRGLPGTRASPGLLPRSPRLHRARAGDAGSPRCGPRDPGPRRDAPDATGIEAARTCDRWGGRVSRPGRVGWPPQLRRSAGVGRDQSPGDATRRRWALRQQAKWSPAWTARRGPSSALQTLSLGLPATPLAAATALQRAAAEAAALSPATPAARRARSVRLATAREAGASSRT
jgi:hypothetical protein